MTLHSSLISSLPAGVERAILRVLSFHQGAENAIPRCQCCWPISNGMASIFTEREMRAAINSLCESRDILFAARGDYKVGIIPPPAPRSLRTTFSVSCTRVRWTCSSRRRAMKEAAEKIWGKYSPARQMGF